MINGSCWPLGRGSAGLAVVAMVAVGVAGCSAAEEPSTPGATTTVTETTTASPSGPGRAASGSSSPSPSSPSSPSGPSSPSSPSGSGDAAAPLCGTPDLDAQIERERGGGTAGATYLELSLVNRGDHVCRMSGWAGVSLVAGDDGEQVGAAADRIGGDQRDEVTLLPGARAVEEIKVSFAGNYGERCGRVQARGYRIFPPANRQSLYVARPTPACSSPVHLLAVSPVHPVT